MNKLIWISSYPKSGNTWMRFLIANYFYNTERKNNFRIIKNIPKFPKSGFLKNIATKEELIKNPYSIAKYWLKSQKQIKIKNGNFIFLKNHNALASVNGNEFTNENISLASIYVVRDPRDVVVSYGSYRNYDYDKTIEFLCSKKLSYNLTPQPDFPDIEILGSWKFHYISWRDGVPNMPRIIVKFEDLVNNCYKCFYKTINFLSGILDFNIDEEQIKFSVEISKFRNLKNNEKKLGFEDNSGYTNFFRSGKIGQWKSELSNSQITKITNEFEKEMKYLGYL